MAKTLSVMTAPPISPPMFSPNSVTVEITALRNTCRPRIRLLGKPLARAKSTYSDCSTSRIDARRFRIRIAARLKPSVSAGRNR